MTEYRTKNMPMAAALVMQGHTHQRIDKMGRSAVWVFRSSDALMEKVDEFEAKECLVEPSEFISVYCDVRDEMFELLGLGRRDGARP